ncbi:unnamed protein product [Spodoptera littoralis]|uniref:Uncharacterized protein n=1 Tax=Spodoptera littoralis TaxID=7109 RepID=A0A9P0N4W0_SPOLI|nr:unnamed protein product [Spodoptera littoralis]CAH1639954.1 unnamed protein product [Spodoptera littoralis]
MWHLSHHTLEAWASTAGLIERAIAANKFEKEFLRAQLHFEDMARGVRELGGVRGTAALYSNRVKLQASTLHFSAQGEGI